MDLDQAAVLHILNIRHDKPIRRINSNADVVGALNGVLELIFVRFVGRVDDGILFQGDGESFNENAH